MHLADLHSHLVPSVDDGSDSVGESLASLRDLYAEGVRTLVTTPHLLVPRLADDAAVDRVLALHRRQFDLLAEAVLEHGNLPAIGLGQEIWAPDAAALRRVAGRADVGLAGTRWLLVEFGFELQGTHLDVVREAAACGRGIIVAHPERYRYLPGTGPLDLMRRWKEAGALLQVNAGSFSGHYGPGPERVAWMMVAGAMVDLVATDHHGAGRAGVSLREAFGALASRGEHELAGRAMAGAPTELLYARAAEADPAVVRTPAGGG